MKAEWTVVDPETGGKKGQKPTQCSMIPPAFLADLGKLYALGAEKYGRNNWRQGYAWSLTVDAMYRHILLMLSGEWLDSESGLPHVIHITWHMAALHTFYERGLGTNDIAEF